MLLLFSLITWIYCVDEMCGSGSGFKQFTQEGITFMIFFQSEHIMLTTCKSNCKGTFVYIIKVLLLKKRHQ